jgi:predicted component of type VI protein secretion system
MADRVAVRDLSTNGTLVNGVRLEDARRLYPGDEIQIGYRRLRVEFSERPGREPEGASSKPVPISDPPDELGSAGPTSRMPLISREAQEEETQPGSDGWRFRGARGSVAADPPAVTASRLADLTLDRCARCGAQLSPTEDECPKCGYVWPPGHPSARTLEVSLEGVIPRRDPRFAIKVPVLYSSATLTIHAVVRDLSRGGMFIATELLDPVGTPCEVTALPDGTGALRFSGVVAHVSGETTIGSPCGLGVEVLGGNSDALRWLEGTIARLCKAIVD